MCSKIRMKTQGWDNSPCTDSLKRERGRSQYHFFPRLRFGLTLRETSWLCVVLIVMVLKGSTTHAANPNVRMPRQHQSFLKTHCYSCHDESSEEGGVRLDNIPFAISDIPAAERWQKVLGVLNSGEMPPEDETQPGDDEKAAFLEALSATMVEARRMLSDTGGATTMRRLNLREYVNTIRTLLGVQVDTKGLPADTNPGGFDTSGGALFFSSDQLEQYLKVARSALDQAIVRSEKPETKTSRIEAEEDANRRITGVLRGYQMGGYRKYKMWKASGGKPASDFGLVDDKEMDFRKLVWDREAPSYIDYLTRPETKDGALLTVSSPNPQVGLVIPDEMPAGRYIVRARIGVVGRQDPSDTFAEVGFRGENIESAIDLIACRKIRNPMRNPEIMEVEVDIPPLKQPLKVDVGEQTKKRVLLGERVIAFRQRIPNSRNAARFIRYESVNSTGFSPDPTLWIDWVEWEGPIIEQWPPKSHVELLGESEADARHIIKCFAERAFRGKPVRAEYLERLLRLYQTKLDAGEPHEEAIKTPLSIVLASPSFLYLSEPVTRLSESTGNAKRQRGSETSPVESATDSSSLTLRVTNSTPSSSAHTTQISPVELASRLSYFLWSAPPDDELLQLASSDELDKPAVLTAQVNRMLADERAREFVSGFAHQWLHMERLDFFQFNYRLYPEFDDSVKAAARQEVYETILTMLRRNRPVGQLLKSDTVLINDLLADFYEIDGVRGPHFREVKVAADQPRGGLLGMAAILAMGSDGQRSSPVERGAWVLRKLLHDPPPPAPANIPQLSRHAGKLLSARELLTAHMEEPQCYQCHRKIDPIGFGLEHFDAVGKWRETEYTEIAVNNRVRKSKEHPIDASGQLPSGIKFNGFFELRDAVADQEEAFARGLIEHLIEYALGRPFGFSDEELSKSILATSKKHKLTMRSMIHAIVQSEEFQTKR